MNCLILVAVVVLISLSEARRRYYNDITVESLCDDPKGFKADRLLNNSVRIYKNDLYWELIGIPDNDKSFLLGPYKIWYQHLAPIGRADSLMTELEGQERGRLYRFRGLYWWGWKENGQQWHGGRDGRTWDQLINSVGFNALFHTGNKSTAMFIALETIYVRYYTTRGYWPYPDGDESWAGRRGYVGGRFGENFPPDVDTAFSWPADDPSDEYMVYLFKNDKFCFRPKKTKSGEPCDEWVLNTRLFGCDRADTGGQPAEVPAVEPNGPNPPIDGDDVDDEGDEENPDEAAEGDSKDKEDKKGSSADRVERESWVSLYTVLVLCLVFSFV